jgi:aspartyl-tRNA(Asn)/glutamyl-tRNA(Gln) amidotransferase subunit A
MSAESLKAKVKLIKSGKLKAVENVMSFSKKIATPNVKDLNIFLHLNEEAIAQAKAIDKRIAGGKRVGKLAGLCFAVKSNICVKGIVANCASKVLENYVAPYNASVINKLIGEDAIVLGMVNMDEFACGASGETSAYGPTKNPVDPTLIPGGTSSGSAASVAAGLCDFSLGSDTGGSTRNPASHCGVVGLKPTYGAVSRYGLIDMTMSFDVIAPVSGSAEDVGLVFDVIKGQDNFDCVSRDGVVVKKNVDGAKGLRVGLVNVSEFCDKNIAEMIKKKTTEIAEDNGWKVKSVNLPLGIALETYYIIVYTEFFSGTRKFDGRRFGLKIDSAGGPEVIRRILGGAEITKAEYAGKYYRSALGAQKFIRGEFEKLFRDVDVLILPTVPKLAHKLGAKISIKDMYSYDVLTVLASIAGIPGISVPVGEIEGKPVGLQVLAPWFREDLVVDVGGKVSG